MQAYASLQSGREATTTPARANNIEVFIMKTLIGVLAVVVSFSVYGAENLQVGKMFRPYVGDSAMTTWRPRHQYLKTLGKFGSREKEIELLKIQMAELIALTTMRDSSYCGKIEWGDLSERSTINNLQFYVYCSNGSKKYLSEFQIRDFISDEPHLFTMKRY